MEKLRLTDGKTGPEKEGDFCQDDMPAGSRAGNRTQGPLNTPIPSQNAVLPPKSSSFPNFAAAIRSPFPPIQWDWGSESLSYYFFTPHFQLLNPTESYFKISYFSPVAIAPGSAASVQPPVASLRGHLADSEHTDQS